MGMTAHQKHFGMNAQYRLQGIFGLEFIERDVGAENCQTVSRQRLQLLPQPGLLVFAKTTFIAAGAHQTHIVHHDETDPGTLETSVRSVYYPRVCGHITGLAFHAIDIPVVVARHTGPG